MVGFTVGKKIMGIRIVKVDGSKLGYGVMVLRVIVAGIIYVLTLGIGLNCKCIYGRDSRRQTSNS